MDAYDVVGKGGPEGCQDGTWFAHDARAIGTGFVPVGFLPRVLPDNNDNDNMDMGRNFDRLDRRRTQVEAELDSRGALQYSGFEGRIDPAAC